MLTLMILLPPWYFWCLDDVGCTGVDTAAVLVCCACFFLAFERMQCVVVVLEDADVARRSFAIGWCWRFVFRWRIGRWFGSVHGWIV